MKPFFQEIFMEKNGTNQLGITLGYDAKASSLGSLFVCEVSTHTHTPTHSCTDNTLTSRE